MLLAISVNTNEVNFYYFLSAGSSSYIQYSLPMALHLNVLIDMLCLQTFSLLVRVLPFIIIMPSVKTCVLWNLTNYFTKINWVVLTQYAVAEEQRI